MKKVIILGSTGSIGRNAVKVINNLKGFKIIGLAAYNNHRLLSKQTQDTKPEMIAIVNEQHYKSLNAKHRKVEVTSGEKGITDIVANTDADVIICAFARSVGIWGIVKAIQKRMRICLATKEILVSFGDIIMKMVKKNGVELLPIDSEHSAIYQCLEGKRKDDVKSIILTASGGPFLNKPLDRVKKSDVLKHPVWKMGTKITVDSASMMNKGLEVIEAHHLFGLPPDKIKVVIHPEAICHSLVQFVDGSLLAQLSTPDMKLPIQYALTAPKRLFSSVKCLDIKEVKNLRFSPPNFKKFPCLKYAYDALKRGKSMPAVLNAANEEAVKLFLENKIKFNEISKIIKKVLKTHIPKKGSIRDYIRAEKWTREYIRSLVC